MRHKIAILHGMLTEPFQSPSNDPTAARGSLDSTWPPGHLESTWPPPGHLAAAGSLQSIGSARQVQCFKHTSYLSCGEIQNLSIQKYKFKRGSCRQAVAKECFESAPNFFHLSPRTSPQHRCFFSFSDLSSKLVINTTFNLSPRTSPQHR